MYKVTVFSNPIDGTLHKFEVIDRDGDSYNDYSHTTVSKNNQIISENEVKEDRY